MIVQAGLIVVVLGFFYVSKITNSILITVIVVWSATVSLFCNQSYFTAVAFFSDDVEQSSVVEGWKRKLLLDKLLIRLTACAARCTHGTLTCSVALVSFQEHLLLQALIVQR